jgi:hypothetical protein
MGTGSLFWRGGDIIDCDINYALPSSAEVKERVELYLYSASVPSYKVMG